MKIIKDWIEEATGLEHGTQENILSSLVVILFLWAISQLLLRIIQKRNISEVSQYHWRKTILYSVRGIGVLVLAQIWVEAFGSVATFLGLVSAGIAIALKDPLSDLAGWLFLIWRKPFIVGDRVEMDGYAGDVIDIRLFQYTIIEIGNWVEGDQSTGRMVHIPNAKIFTTELVNYSREFEYIWYELPVLVTFESDWRKAKNILIHVVEEDAREQAGLAAKAFHKASKDILLPHTDPTSKVYTSVKDSGVLLTMRFMCNVWQGRILQEKIWEHVLDEFAQHPDIDFAYPTQRFYQNFREGKHVAQPSNGPS